MSMRSLSLFLSTLFFFLFTFGSVLTAEDYRMILLDGISAFHIGRGNIEGFSDQAHGVFENPAGLVRIPYYSVSLSSTRYFGETQISNLALGWNWDEGRFALGYMDAVVADNPDTREVDIGDDPRGYWDYRNGLIKLAYARPFAQEWSAGIGAGYYFQNIAEEKGSGWGVDAGLLWRRGPWEVSSFGRNLLPGMAVKYTSGRSETLPFQWINSVRYRLPEWDVAGQWHTERGGNAFALGAVFRPEWVPYLEFSAGMRQSLVLNDTKSAMVFGLSLLLDSIRFDYALEKSGYYGDEYQHFFSISYSPAPPKRAAPAPVVISAPAKPVVETPVRPAPVTPAGVLPESPVATSSVVSSAEEPSAEAAAAAPEAEPAVEAAPVSVTVPPVETIAAPEPAPGRPEQAPPVTQELKAAPVRPVRKPVQSTPPARGIKTEAPLPRPVPAEPASPVQPSDNPTIAPVQPEVPVEEDNQNKLAQRAVIAAAAAVAAALIFRRLSRSGR